MKNYFSVSETCCQCGCGFDITEPTRQKLNQIRKMFGQPLTISGPARCVAHNIQESPTHPNSRHTFGDGVDISTAGMAERDKIRLACIAVFCGSRGIGVGSNFLHVDFRPGVLTYWYY